MMMIGIGMPVTLVGIPCGGGSVGQDGGGNAGVGVGVPGATVPIEVNVCLCCALT